MSPSLGSCKDEMKQYGNDTYAPFTAFILYLPSLFWAKFKGFLKSEFEGHFTLQAFCLAQKAMSLGARLTISGQFIRETMITVSSIQRVDFMTGTPIPWVCHEFFQIWNAVQKSVASRYMTVRSGERGLQLCRMEETLSILEADTCAPSLAVKLLSFSLTKLMHLAGM